MGPQCQAWHHDRINTRAEDAKALGIPLIISEFGACYGSNVCAREITQVADECDKVLAGWAYWEFKIYKDLTTTAGTGSEGFYNQDGSLQDVKVKALARTYLPSTQGTLLSMNFNVNTSDFTATFRLNASITLPTEIYINEQYWYPNNYTITISPENGKSFTIPSTNSEFGIHTFLLTENDGQIVTVTVAQQ